RSPTSFPARRGRLAQFMLGVQSIHSCTARIRTPAALMLRSLALVVCTRLPLTRGVALDVYNIDNLVVLASVPAVPVSVTLPSWTPLTHVNTAAAPIAIVV